MAQQLSKFTDQLAAAAEAMFGYTLLNMRTRLKSERNTNKLNHPSPL